MLCNCIETGKIKCHQYWPLEQGQKLVFGEAPNTISVANLGAKKMAPDEQCINVTTLKVDWGQGSRTIQHLQWENWPDRGVPQTNLTAIVCSDLLECYFNSKKFQNLLSATRGNQNPILVHCSAGIGRTGTIVAIAYVQDKMMAGVNTWKFKFPTSNICFKENCMAMNELIKELRSHRPWSIQNEFVRPLILNFSLTKHISAILVPPSCAALVFLGALQGNLRGVVGWRLWGKIQEMGRRLCSCHRDQVM